MACELAILNPAVKSHYLINNPLQSIQLYSYQYLNELSNYLPHVLLNIIESYINEEEYNYGLFQDSINKQFLIYDLDSYQLIQTINYRKTNISDTPIQVLYIDSSIVRNIETDKDAILPNYILTISQLNTFQFGVYLFCLQDLYNSNNVNLPNNNKINNNNNNNACVHSIVLNGSNIRLIKLIHRTAKYSEIIMINQAAATWILRIYHANHTIKLVNQLYLHRHWVCFAHISVISFNINDNNHNSHNLFIATSDNASTTITILTHNYSNNSKATNWIISLPSTKTTIVEVVHEVCLLYPNIYYPHNNNNKINTTNKANNYQLISLLGGSYCNDVIIAAINKTHYLPLFRLTSPNSISSLINCPLLDNGYYNNSEYRYNEKYQNSPSNIRIMLSFLQLKNNNKVITHKIESLHYEAFNEFINLLLNSNKNTHNYTHTFIDIGSSRNYRMHYTLGADYENKVKIVINTLLHNEIVKFNDNHNTSNIVDGTTKHTKPNQSGIRIIFERYDAPLNKDDAADDDHNNNCTSIPASIHTINNIDCKMHQLQIFNDFNNSKATDNINPINNRNIPNLYCIFETKHAQLYKLIINKNRQNIYRIDYNINYQFIPYQLFNPNNNNNNNDDNNTNNNYNNSHDNNAKGIQLKFLIHNHNIPYK